ncbi:MAG: ribosome small subunit-dependent GTPase A [Lentisphaeria bacterium]|nr:ribosome small subunit-dependent GTPase A [Candidatus Neomarinimicrobiota bacterium]MCF7841858.1 ribosome small subunit-dependent GTPase A [Lentisphaeria bacterium]
MNLSHLGYNHRLAQTRIENNLTEFEIGRVIAQHKERYVVKTEAGDFEAEVTGSLRFSAETRADFPAVGDWVALTGCDGDFAVIHQIYPRFSTISRQAVGQFGKSQIIATNIDYALILQAVDRDFSVNRLERYLTICHTSKVSPVIVLTKTDLISESLRAEILEKVQQRVKDAPVFAISNETRHGYDALCQVIKPGKTFCLLGSSGVGKSTLVNNLSGRNVMRTGVISGSSNRGRHITSHRELILLENGGILIDNPGMREVGIADTDNGLETTFDSIFTLAENCKFKDCTHTREMGCAVLTAVESGSLDSGVLDNYHKMLKEKSVFETSVREKRKQAKIFGKIQKDYQKKDFKGRRH